MWWLVRGYFFANGYSVAPVPFYWKGYLSSTPLNWFGLENFWFFWRNSRILELVGMFDIISYMIKQLNCREVKCGRSVTVPWSKWELEPLSSDSHSRALTASNASEVNIFGCLDIFCFWCKLGYVFIWHRLLLKLFWIKDHLRSWKEIFHICA